MEIYRAVIGYEGIYEVSDIGNVKRIGTWKDNWGKVRQPNPNPMKPGNTNGYRQVHLAKNGVKKPCYIHVLVAAAFIGPRPPKYDVNHKNGIKSDNRVENLEYATRKENSRHMIDVLERKPGNWINIGELHHNSVTIKEAVIAMRAMHKAGKTIQDCADAFDLEHSTASAIIHRRTWKHV